MRLLGRIHPVIPGRTAGVAVPQLLAALVAFGTLTAEPAEASEEAAPTPVFGVRVGGEGVVLSDGIGPGVGLRAGIRVHPRLAILADANVSAPITDVAHWNLLGGARLNPILESSIRLDLDVMVGAGNSGPRSMGRYVVDGEALRRVPIGRVEGTLLFSGSTRVGIGPRLRYEIQPVFVRSVGHLPDGTEDVSERLAWRGHQVQVAVAWEADGLRGVGHVSWDLGGGFAVSGDGDDVGAMVCSMFTWTLDQRPARRPMVR